MLRVQKIENKLDEERQYTVVLANEKGEREYLPVRIIYKKELCEWFWVPHTGIHISQAEAQAVFDLLKEANEGK